VHALVGLLEVGPSLDTTNGQERAELWELVTDADELIGRDYHAPSSASLVWRGNVPIPRNSAEKNLVITEERFFWVLGDLELKCRVDYCHTFSVEKEQFLERLSILHDFRALQEDGAVEI